MKRIAIAAGLLLAAVALGGVLRPEGARAVDDPVAARDTVTVNGMGSVRATPDRASISAGVETRGATAQAALAANASAMNQVLDALRSSGGKDVTTSIDAREGITVAVVLLTSGGNPTPVPAEPL